MFFFSKSKLNITNKIVSAMLLSVVGFGMILSPAQAYSRSDYSALLVSTSGGGSITMEPGERRQIITEWKNIGSAPWVQEGNAYISLYTYGPKYRKSVFDPGTWMGPSQLRPMESSKVAPGEMTKIIFDLHAPLETGVYKETFNLAAEDKTWVTGGEFTINIKVADKSEIIEDQPVVSNDEPKVIDESAGYDAELTVLTANELQMKAGRSVMLTAAFKNTGTTSWSKYGLVQPDVQLASSDVSFTHPSWNGSQLAMVDDVTVAPGELAIVNFSLTAPSVNGKHEARFQLQANGIDIDGAEVVLPVTVTGGSEAIAKTPVNKVEDSAEDINYHVDEPDLRVGVLIVDEETENKVVITSSVSDYVLKDINGNLLAELKKDQRVTAFYSETDQKYFYDVGRGLEMSTYGLRFEPLDELAPMTVTNFDRRLTRGQSFAYNTFRGTLELRYNDYKERTWLVNELPFEVYLRGLAEMSDYHPMEAQKAQVTAARTYAYFHFLRDGKRTREFIDLASSSADQVYKGYEREMQAPHTAEAVELTRGILVTYEGEVAITPYYARSNGHTKNWSSVWWGNQPQNAAVSVPCDAGKTQWGHGVGMPQSGAICMAKDGDDWEKILHYFYTDVELTPWWK